MFELRIDAAPFEEQTKAMDAAADQMPFSISRALNDAADETYDGLIADTWPKAVKVRNAAFLRWALRTKFSTKYDLSIAIFDSTPDQRGHLNLHAQGGTKVGKGGRLAVPTGNVDRGPSGVYMNQRPAALSRKVVKGNLIFQAIGRGKSHKLRLMYVLAKSARQPLDVPFEADFSTSIGEGAAKHFKARMMQAMRSRR
jgi:hypothetical protein